MRSIDEHINNRKIDKILKHPRLKMLDEFEKRINTQRVEDGMKKLPVSAIGVKTAHLSLDDMGYLLKKCQNSRNFSKTFFGLLKVKKQQDANEA